MRKKIIKLPYCGILLHNRNNVNKSINVQVYFKVGSANSAYKPGLLHFGEHLRGDRTKNLTRQQMIEENSKKSIDFGAGTSDIYIRFHLNCHKKYFKEAFTRLIEVMLNDKPTVEEFENEKKIINAEINRAKADVNKQFFRKADKVIYTNKFFHINTLGEKKDVGKFTNRQVQNHISKIINTNNLVVSIFWKYLKIFFKKICQKYFSFSNSTRKT